MTASKFTFLTTALLLTAVCPAAWGVPIFLHPDARFSSGDLPPNQLKTTGETMSIVWIKAKGREKRDKPFWLSRLNLFSALDLVDHATTLAPLPRLSARTGEAVTILARAGGNDLVEFKNKRQWVGEHSLKPSAFEFGKVFVKKATLLRRQPNAASNPITSVADGLWLQAVASKRDFILVKYKNFSGWLSLNDTITKLDFTTAAQTRNDHRWHQVLSTTGSWLKTADAGLINLADVSRLDAGAVKYFVRNLKVRAAVAPSYQSPTAKYRGGLLSRGEGIVPVSETNVTWFQTDDGEGSAVWFRKPSSSDNAEIDLLDESPAVSIAHLTRRQIYALATDPVRKTRKIASAKGVFFTVNGTDWHELEQFDHVNYPVSIAPNGDLYVGDRVSHDNGKTFQAYLRWDKIFARIARIKKIIPENLRLVRIDTSGKKLRVDVSYGHPKAGPHPIQKLLSLVSSDGGAHWHYEDLQTLSRSPAAPDLSTFAVNSL